MNSELGNLIGTGFALGMVHVFTGPDHLSALATLTANVGNKIDAGLLGIRWGVGHSSGLMVVGVGLIVMSSGRQNNIEMPDVASHIFEAIVGILMLFLGIYGVRRAWLRRPKSYYNPIDLEVSSPVKERFYEGETENDNHGDGNSVSRYLNDTEKLGASVSRVNSTDVVHCEVALSEGCHERIQPQSFEIYFDGESSPVCIPPTFGSHNEENGEIIAFGSDDSDVEGAVVVEQTYLDTVSPSRCRRFWNRLTRQLSPKALAFLIGIAHGVAGPGGVLGVIPAVQLRDWKLAAIYLGCFCTSSTITMGFFATCYGTCSSRIVGNGADTRREFYIECFSACLSIIVGISWLILLSIGKLADVFP